MKHLDHIINNNNLMVVKSTLDKLTFKLLSQPKVNNLLVNELKAQSKQVVFVMTPIYGGIDERAFNTNSAVYFQHLSKSLNIPVLNYNAGLAGNFPSIEQSYFSDCSHLNKAGSEVFSKILKKDLDRMLKQGDNR